jgi:hypothetical protein
VDEEFFVLTSKDCFLNGEELCCGFSLPSDEHFRVKEFVDLLFLRVCFILKENGYYKFTFVWLLSLL